MTGKPETVSEYPASLVVATLRTYQTSDDFRWCDQSWRTAFFAGPVPECDNSTELEGKW